MSDETENEDVDAEDVDEGAAPKKTPGKKLVLFAGLPVALLVLGGAAAFLLLGGGGDDDHADADGHGEAELHADAGHGGGHGGGHGDDDHGDDGHGAASSHGGGHGSAHDVVFYELPDLLVNIRTDDSRPTYLKLTLTLEVDSAATAHEIELAMPRVMDRFQSFLRELRVEDLNGSAGSYRLRQELLRRVNLAVAPIEVRAVLIEEMLIQ